MGAANKLDPSLVQVADLAKTKKCRLARIIRKELRKRGIERGIKVVFSTEEFRPLANADGERKPLLGSSSYLPPIFGLTMAAEVIQSLLGDFA
jgi:tRNA A37 threonylcarbamoyladenosine dehydratase